MVVRATPVLTAPVAKPIATAGFGVAIGAFYTWSESLPNLSLWADVAVGGLIVIPAVFALVYLVLPMRAYPGLPLVGLGFAGLAWALVEADAGAAANFAKLAAATAVGFWFVRFFVGSPGLVVLVACLVPLVDAYSVFRGPTESIIDERPEVFTAVSFSFPLPGEHDAARIGPPDLLFFAFFLGAAAQFGLRVRLTWLCLALSIGATLAISVALESDGLPALPGLALAFLIPNADLLWRALRGRRVS
jgi:hypothetical protein